jgi:hypothetical protein
MWMKTTVRKPTRISAGEPRENTPLGRALHLIASLDIPAKGRIAHHLRTGRIPRAMTLMSSARLLLWRRLWLAADKHLVDQVGLLARLESVLLEIAYPKVRTLPAN